MYEKFVLRRSVGVGLVAAGSMSVRSTPESGHWASIVLNGR